MERVVVVSTDASPPHPCQVPQFPLLTEGIKFYAHEDHMVRVAVRTLTLNVFRVDDPAARAFVANRAAVPYISNIVWEMMRRYREMDALAGCRPAPRRTPPPRAGEMSGIGQDSGAICCVAWSWGAASGPFRVGRRRAAP